MTTIILPGRTDTDDYFEISGIFELPKLIHTPFLAFSQTEDVLEVHIVINARELLEYPNDTPVMGQWSGKWRSDFFRFTVGQYRAYLEEQARRQSEL